MEWPSHKACLNKNACLKGWGWESIKENKLKPQYILENVHKWQENTQVLSVWVKPELTGSGNHNTGEKLQSYLFLRVSNLAATSYINCFSFTNLSIKPGCRSSCLRPFGYCPRPTLTCWPLVWIWSRSEPVWMWYSDSARADKTCFISSLSLEGS